MVSPRARPNYRPHEQPHLAPVRTDVHVRLDRLPWSRFHWLVVGALGASWAIDGLEVTLAGAVGAVLEQPASLGLSSAQVGAAASAYLLGAVIGALVCGYLTDRHGRKRLFFVTLAIYLAGTLLTAFAWDFWSLAAFRWITGFGIGGEYAAINSAIDELIPARVRGRVNLFINGSYWIGAAAGALGTLVLLDVALFPVDVGWRLGFGIGATLGLLVLFARRHIPESPRWLVMHGYQSQALAVMADLETRTGARTAPEAIGRTALADCLIIYPRRHINLRDLVHVLFRRYPRRSVLGLTLITSQAFLYNAIFFTYALVLVRFYGVPAGNTGIYLLPFALGNFLGPLLLGRFFDTIGRRVSIATTYAISGLLLLATGALFRHDLLTAQEQTLLWAVIFFFASAAASAAYLTVSELFPLELRALAIAVFFALGTAIGGVAAPWLFGALIGTGSRESVFLGYALGAGLMLVAAAIEAWLGVDAERRSLEHVAPPLFTRDGMS
ncbi:MAG: MFS transporter [Burkholderiales bacterium]